MCSTSLMCNVTFIASEGLTAAWPIIVFSCKNWPTIDPDHTADITIPAVTKIPPAIIMT